MAHSAIFQFPAPTGQHALGTTALHLKDANRKETHEDSAINPRELMVQIWYPAQGTQQPPTNAYNVEPCAEMLKLERGISFEQSKDLAIICTHAHPDATPKSNHNYPVIIFSPGFNCPRTNNTANCEEIASHGYIVVGIDPTYAAAMVKFPDGRTIKGKNINILDQKVDDVEQQVWLDDTIFVLNQLEKLNTNLTFPLRGMLDVQNVGIFGHSYGGSTAAQLCRLDKRCHAGVSLDGGLFGKNPIVGFDKPFMFILAQDWPWAHLTTHDFEKLHITQKQFEDVRVKWLEYIPALCNAIKNDTYQIAIKNTKHNDFSDSTLIKEIPSLKTFNLDVGTLNGFRTTEIVNAYLVTFFNKYLKEQSSELLDGMVKKYEEVETMKNLRIYGIKPFNIAIVHGGPGIPGEVAPVANELSKTHGTLEPLQTKSTIEGQLQELKSVLQKNGTLPLTLIGYSWGAWLSFIFAAQNPSFVKKLVLVSSGPFEASYATNIMDTRLNRLTEKERLVVETLLAILSDPAGKDKDLVWANIGKYLPKTDSYDPLPHQDEGLKFQYNIYESVWKEAAELRNSGKLLALGKQIQCPVVAIHGDYDPHPAEGVQKPLSTILENFRFMLLEHSGHKPWIEHKAREKFYKIFKEELV